MDIVLQIETFCKECFLIDIEPTMLTDLAVESTARLINLFLSAEGLRGELLKELIKSEFLGCSAMMAKRNQLDAITLLRLIRRECFPSARTMMKDYQTQINQLFGMAKENPNDYYLTAGLETEFRTYCISVARKVPVHCALKSGKPDIDGVQLWLILGTIFTISLKCDIKNGTAISTSA